MVLLKKIPKRYIDSTSLTAPLVSLDEFMKPTELVLKHDPTITSKLPEQLQSLHEFSHNYEHPSCIDWEKFAARIGELSNPESSERRNYIIVEGIRLFAWSLLPAL